MTIRFKYLGLIIGILMVFLSFLFFGRRQDDYLLLLLVGLLFSSVFYLALLFGNHSKKTKTVWTIVIFLSVIVQWLTEPMLLDCSCKIFISENEAHAPGTNYLLYDKPAGIFITKDTIIDPSKALSNNEKFVLYYKIDKLDGVSCVTKNKDYIYYRFEGSRHGVIYWTGKSKPDISYRHLTEHWYR
jgi:hypothetical protein